MTTLIPATEIEPGLTLKLRQKLDFDLRAIILRVRGTPSTTRDLRPRDILAVEDEEASWSSPEPARFRNREALQADVWCVDALRGRPVDTHSAVGIMGFATVADSPAIDAVRFRVSRVAVLTEIATTILAAFPRDGEKTDPATLPRWRVGYLSNPIIFAPNELVGIDLLAHRSLDPGEEAFCLFGLIAEQEGRRVIPDRDFS